VDVDYVPRFAVAVAVAVAVARGVYGGVYGDGAQRERAADVALDGLRPRV
jgi:hypothetical protein